MERSELMETRGDYGDTSKNVTEYLDGSLEPAKNINRITKYIYEVR